MGSNTFLVILLPVAGAFAGGLLQQILEVWKTATTHKQELRRRFFDRKFDAAIDLARTLDAIVRNFGARLSEAVEWTRDDEQFMWLDVARDVLSLQTQTLQKNYDRYVDAQAVVDLLFPAEFVDSPEWAGLGNDLNEAWRTFGETRSGLIRRLNELMPESRADALRQQRTRGVYDDGVHEELERWMAVYKQGASELRAMLPRLAELTAIADNNARTAVRALRVQLAPYHA